MNESYIIGWVLSGVVMSGVLHLGFKGVVGRLVGVALWLTVGLSSMFFR